jgi:membrane-bound ClpP family serine protease
MGLLLVILGLLLWLLGGYQTLGLILIVLGVILLFVPGVPYGYGWYRGRGAPPP